MLQEVDMEIIDKKGVENGVANYLSRMRIEDSDPIDDTMPEEQLMFSTLLTKTSTRRTCWMKYMQLKI